MSTSRHLLNRQRRLAARTTTAPTARAESEPPANKTELDAPSPIPRSLNRVRAPARPGTTDATTGTDAASAANIDEPAPESEAGNEGGTRTARRRSYLLGTLALVTVVLGAFAGWATAQAGSLRDTAAVRNAALTDTAHTSEAKGAVTDAVEALFSYDYSAPRKNRTAADRLLTGPAVAQHAQLLGGVRKRGPKQQLVLTTTVTDAAVEHLTTGGDTVRARLLLFADQRSTRASGAKQDANSEAKEGDSAYAGAMLAVDAVRSNGTWRLNRIDTFQ